MTKTEIVNALDSISLCNYSDRKSHDLTCGTWANQVPVAKLLQDLFNANVLGANKFPATPNIIKIDEPELANLDFPVAVLAYGTEYRKDGYRCWVAAISEDGKEAAINWTEWADHDGVIQF